MKKLILLSIMICFGFCLNAQTFYEVNFYDEENTEYIGLVIYYNENNCKVRIFTEEQLANNEVSESVYQQRIGQKENKDDIGIMFYEPVEDGFPYFIWCWEKDDASDMNERPFVAFDVNDVDTWIESEYFTEISLRDMDQEYVLQFYGPDEPEYKMLMAGINKINQQANRGGYGENSRWHNNDRTTNANGQNDQRHFDHRQHFNNHTQHWGNRDRNQHVNGNNHNFRHHNNQQQNIDSQQQQENNNQQLINNNIQSEIATTNNNAGNVAIDDSNIDPNAFANTAGSTLTIEEQPTQTNTPNTNNLGNFHFIVVANTGVSDIGTACKVDLDNLRSEFKGISKVLGMPYIEHEISGETYSKENLATVIKDFKAESNDVVVFVYTGHGFRFQDQTDYYPNMDLSASSYDDCTKNFVALSDVYKELKNKGARLTVVLSDCCNSVINANRPVLTTNSLFSRSNNNYDIEKLQSLFVYSEGSLLATAASPGEYSWCGITGGFFIMSVIESLRSQISALNTNNPSWDTLLSDAISAAATKTETNASCEKQNGLKQVQVKSTK